MPHPNACARVFVRDGFLCRYCHERVYVGPIVKLLCAEAPDLQLYDQHGQREPLRSRWATVDHVVALHDGGTDCLENLVTSCSHCNSSCGGTGVTPPAYESVSGWQGYADCFLALAPKHSSILTKTDNDWVKAFRWAGVSENLAFVESALEELRSLKSN